MERRARRSRLPKAGVTGEGEGGNLGPRGFQWVFTAFMAVYVPAYWAEYGLVNFLWLSNLTLMVAFVATWGQWRFLASLAAVGGLMAEVAWSIDFVVTAVLRLMGSEASGFTEYVFRPELAVWLRVLGGFHLLLPPLLIWLIYRLGYDRRAWRLAVPLGWLLLAVSWLFTAPERNINLVYSYLRLQWLDMNAPIYLLFAAITLAGAMAVTHLILMMALGRRTFPK